MQKVIPFHHLPDSDLFIDALYKGGTNKNTSDDPINRLVRGGNQGGFRYVGSSTDIIKCQLVILYTSGDDPDWPDAIDSEAGSFIFFGDNKKPGHELHDTPRKGNLILKKIFEAYYPDINILVISMLETEESILRMLRMGVKGYLSKDIEVEDMHAALKAIANKGFYYSDLVSEIMLQNIQQGEVKSVQDIEFSEKDREFLKLVCSEMTYQQIADKMNLSPKTIEGYREALFKRLKVKNRVSLALYAVKHGYFRME